MRGFVYPGGNEPGPRALRLPLLLCLFLYTAGVIGGSWK